MRITDFDIYKDLLKEKSGLILSPDQSYILDSRLNPIARKWGYDSLDAMTTALHGVPNTKLVNDVVEAMTDNETCFFRDTIAYYTIKNLILPYMINNRGSRKKVNIWCAASASGQEPYSLAMLLKEDSFFQVATWKTKIKATDICKAVLEKAKNGDYTQLEAQRGLDVLTLLKHFKRGKENWQINQDIRNMVSFDYFNLLDSMSGLGHFDIIVCRNVLHNFDEETCKNVLERMANQLEPDGFLVLDSAEKIKHVPDALKPLSDQKGVFVRADAPELSVAANQALA